jgi:lipopolysaccharide export system permease protein
LGSIIRKGGLGTPLIAAISFFMIFYFTTTVGEKFAKQDKLTPFAGMWLAAFILVPIGIFLTYKAMRDSQLFNKEWYYRNAKVFRLFIQRITKKYQSVKE